MTIDECRLIARARWQCATAFRVGMVAGELALPPGCPYAENSRAAGQYWSGIEHSTRFRALRTGSTQ